MPRRKSKLKTVQIKKITAIHIIKITQSSTEIFKKEINDLKLFEKIKEEYSEAMRRDEEDQKYV